MNAINTINKEETRDETRVSDPDLALFADAGIKATVIWEGSAGDCPWPAHEKGVSSAA